VLLTLFGGYFMARASGQFKTIEREVVKVEQYDELQSVVLTISPNEAQALLALFQHVGGHPEGPRGYIDRITNELADAYAPNVNKYKTMAAASKACKAQGSIYLDER